MPDSDWVKYKQMRGQELPARIDFAGASYGLDQLFKRDFYAATGCYRRLSTAGTGPEYVVLKIYHTDPLWKVIPLRWLGRYLFRRERHFGRLLAGIKGLAAVIGRYGKSGLIREFVPGVNLRQFKNQAKPDANFFPALSSTLSEVHAKGVSHNDLSKPENVLVRENGSPVLIDFQIAVEWRSRLTRWLRNYMQRNDRYHLTKQHRRTRPEDFTAEAVALAKKKGVILTLHDWIIRRPYRAVRHFFLRSMLTAR